jgi:DeoR/GlpR family transcriptional regulator of sugar metabolism
MTAADQTSAEGSDERRSSRERRALIRDRILNDGAVRIAELASELGVTVMTIHRDLNVLESEGWLRKVRGGATVDATAGIDTSVRHRLTATIDAKAQVARHAMRHLDGADAVMLDDSTTALQLAHLLPGRGRLTVITNFLVAINALADAQDIHLIGLGGDYDATYAAFHGIQVRDQVAKLRCDVVFMSTTAVLDGFLYHKSQETILIRHALMASAARKVLLVDHTKFRRRAVHQLAPLTDFDAVIVDAGIDPGDLRAMRELGVEVEVAPAGDDARSPGRAAPST